MNILKMDIFMLTMKPETYDIYIDIFIMKTILTAFIAEGSK